MAESYDIIYNDRPVGTARMEKQGLYLFFSCRCTLPDEEMYRIHAISGDAREDLGICIPMDGAFGMDKKIPAKRLGDGRLTFELAPKDWKPREIVPEPEPVPQMEETEEETVQNEFNEEVFVPVSEEEPFEHLDKLEDARMEMRDDQVGIVIQE